MLNDDNKAPLYLFILSLLTYASKCALNLFLAHHLARDIYGDFSVAIRLLSVMVTLTLFGTDIGSQRFFGKFINTGQHTNATAYVAWNFKLLTITFSVAITIALLSSIIMVGLHTLGLNNINNYHLAVYSLWLVPLAAIVSLLSSYLLFSEHLYLATILSKALKYSVQLVLFLSSIFFLQPVLSNLNIALILLITFLSLLVIAMVSFNQEIASILQLGLQQAHQTSLDQNWLKTSGHLIANTLLVGLLAAIDLLIIEMFGFNEVMVGDYAAILTIVGILWVIPTGILQGLKPQFSTLLSTPEGIQLLEKKLIDTNRITIGACIFLGTGIILFAKKLLGLFGPDYTHASTALIIMATGVTLSCIGRIITTVLVYGGYEKLVVRWTTICILILVGFGIPSTYYFGTNGIATVSAFVLILRPAALLRPCYRQLKLRCLRIN